MLYLNVQIWPNMKIASPQLPLIPCFLKIKMQSRELCHRITKMFQILHRLNWKCWKWLFWCMMLLSNIYNKKCFKLKIIISFDTNCHYKLFTKLFVTFKLHILFNFSKNVSRCLLAVGCFFSFLNFELD